MEKKRTGPMINLSTKSRYAARIMVYLATRWNCGATPAQEIAKVENLSVDYTEQILGKLKTAGLVISRRGAKGGFHLASDPENTTIADIVSAVDGPPQLIPCLTEPCEHSDTCATKVVWEEANAALTTVFQKRKLSELAAFAIEATSQKLAPEYQI